MLTSGRQMRQEMAVAKQNKQSWQRSLGRGTHKFVCTNNKSMLFGEMQIQQGGNVDVRKKRKILDSFHLKRNPFAENYLLKADTPSGCDMVEPKPGSKLTSEIASTASLLES
jgi:hypothetical protein